MTPVTLCEAEQHLAKYVAKGREAANRRAGVADGRIGPQDNETTDLEGVGAEIAFCKLHNLYPDLDLGHRPNFDAVMHSGERVDVKGTRWRNGHLLAVRTKKDKPPDLYGLMVGEFPTYQYVGLMAGYELLQEHRLKDFGRGPSYAARQDELFTK